MWSQAGLNRKDFNYLWDHIYSCEARFYRMYDSDYRDQTTDWNYVDFNLALFESLNRLFEDYLEKVAKKNKIDLDENRGSAVSLALAYANSGDKLVVSLLKSVANEIKNSFKDLKSNYFTTFGKVDNKSYKNFVQKCDAVLKTIDLLAGLGVRVKI